MSASLALEVGRTQDQRRHLHALRVAAGREQAHLRRAAATATGAFAGHALAVRDIELRLRQGLAQAREAHGQEKVVFQKDPLGRDELVTEYPFFDFFRPPALIDAKLILPVVKTGEAVIWQFTMSLPLLKS
jgi:hypothetical protein